MDWRVTRSLVTALALGAAAVSCFEVPPLPEAPRCQSNDDCTDQVFCNGVERCEEGACVAGVPCEGECVELMGGAGLCPDDAPGPEGEPVVEPGPAPEPERPEPDPVPDPIPEPIEPEPEGRRCAIEGRPCVLREDTPGECRGGVCRPLDCEAPTDCPSPGCATCDNRECGLRPDCASVTLSCGGPPGNRLQLECGAKTYTEECTVDGGRQQPVACDPNMPVLACCGGVDGACRDTTQGAVLVRLTVDPMGRWMCPEDDFADPVCTHPGLLPFTHVDVNCEMDPTDILGKE